MSALVSLFFDNIVFIGTDTLASRPYEDGDDELKPLMYVQKVFHLPHLKSAFACLGYYQIGAKFSELINQRFLGKDIKSIVNIGLEGFNLFLQETNTATLSASLYLYGYDDEAKKFKGYRAHFGHENRDNNVWIPLQSMSDKEGQIVGIMEPPVEYYFEKMDDLFPSVESGISYQELVRRIIVIQKDEDAERPAHERVGIGGEIVLTMLGINENGNFATSSEVTHGFPDKDEVGEYMMELMAIENASRR